MGTVLNRYTEAVGRCFMEGMVARVMRPGCKVDAMPIFEGAQGAGKSTALSIIGGEYFAEIHESITSKDFYIAITGKMLCEISELHAFRRAELERVKGIITTGTDRFRTPYGRYAVDHPRSCVFAGTTNSSDWNTDETGARRFWPVECGEIDRDWLSENRQQLFAEAVARFNRGEAWWDVPEEEAGTERKKVRDFDPWQDLMRGYMDANNAVSIPYIMENILQLAPRDQSVIAARRVGKILRQNGFQNKVQRTPSGESIRRWIKY
jgi:putative DNA primase/helicase